MGRTKILTRVTPTLALGVCLALWAVLEWLVSVSDIVEEVDLVLSCEECRAYAVYWCVSPTLIVNVCECECGRGQ